MRLEFWGGADTVTGSQHVLEVGGRRLLRDCGLYQGRREEARAINRQLPFAADRIAATLLSHAHIDHSGNLPTLVREGFAGPIHATSATCSLADIMLKDAAKIQEQDAAYMNQKTNRKGLPPVEPLYTVADAEAAVKRLAGLEYHQPAELLPGLRHTAYEAGHILGAALSHFELTEQQRTVRVGFAVDLGRRNLPLIRDPELMPAVDVLVMESTYGNREHGPAVDAERQLGEIVARTFARGGRVFIPAFALERAQELLYHLAALVSKGALPRRPIYVDSPMATAITRIFDEKVAYLDEEFRQHRTSAGCLMCPDWIRFVGSVEESKRVSASREPCIVIAASGMCEHGRILHHLKQGIDDPLNSVVIVGFQAQHTLGRRLVEGADEVRIFGDLLPRRAEVAVLDAFSAHAGRDELIDYVRRLRPPRTYLVHGEQTQREALAEALRAERLTEVFLPKRGDGVEL
jgi:metallo-beta-lactamase family protein